MINRNALLIIIITGTCAFRPKGGKISQLQEFVAEWANNRGSPGAPMLAPCRGASRRNPNTSTPRRTRASSSRSSRPQSLQMRRRRRGSRVSGAGGARPGRAVSRMFAGSGELAASSADYGTEIWGSVPEKRGSLTPLLRPC